MREMFVVGYNCKFATFKIMFEVTNRFVNRRKFTVVRTVFVLSGRELAGEERGSNYR